MLMASKVRLGQPQLRLAAVRVHLQSAAAPVHRVASAPRCQAHRRNVQVHRDTIGVNFCLRAIQVRWSARMTCRSVEAKSSRRRVAPQASVVQLGL